MIDGHDDYKNPLEDQRELEELREKVKFWVNQKKIWEEKFREEAERTIELEKMLESASLAYEEVKYLRSLIKDALDLAGERYWEWGDRAVQVFKVLEGIDEESEEEEE